LKVVTEEAVGMSDGKLFHAMVMFLRQFACLFKMVNA